MSALPGLRSDSRADIVLSAHDLIAESGWASAGSARVAKLSGVSKALVHYHFRDKASLLCAVAESCHAGISARRETSASRPQAGASPVDAFMDWLEREDEADDLRVLLQLAMSPDESVRRAASSARDEFRATLTDQVRRVFRGLDLAPRFSEDLFVDVLDIACAGVAADGGVSRHTIEALWLGLLTLAD